MSVAATALGSLHTALIQPFQGASGAATAAHEFASDYKKLASSLARNAITDAILRFADAAERNPFRKLRQQSLVVHCE
jgi:hypothetical protein